MRPVLRAIGSRISSLVHNPRLQNRLQAGSALALAIGWSLSVVLLSGILEPLETRFSNVFFRPEVLSTSTILAQQDRFTAITMVLLMAILAGATLIHLQGLTASALGIIYYLAYLGYAFDKLDTGILVQPLYPLLALVLTSISTMVYRYFEQDRERTLTEQLLRRHLSSDMLNECLRGFDHGATPIRPARHPASILCVELRDSNTGDTLSPGETMQRLDQWASKVTSVIFAHHGLLADRRGSSILAAWNLPLEQPDHTQRAISAAVEIRDALQLGGLDDHRRVSVGLGLSAGCVLAGRIATGPFADYAVFGEPVVIAERLASRRDGVIYLDANVHSQMISFEYDVHEMNPLHLPGQTLAHEVWAIFPPMELEALERTELPDPAEM